MWPSGPWAYRSHVLDDLGLRGSYEAPACAPLSERADIAGARFILWIGSRYCWALGVFASTLPAMCRLLSSARGFDRDPALCGSLADHNPRERDEGTFMSKKVLVVDDSTTVRTQVRLVLERAGFSVTEATDGENAAELMEEGGYDAIVCDVNMPRMNGVEFVEKLQAEGKHPSIPILMLTTEGAPDLIERAKAAGVKGWMVKPFRADLVVETLNKLTAAA